MYYLSLLHSFKLAKTEKRNPKPNPGNPKAKADVEPRAGSIIWNCSELQVDERMSHLWLSGSEVSPREQTGTTRGSGATGFGVCVQSEPCCAWRSAAGLGRRLGAAGGWSPPRAARRHLRLSPALETRSCWAEHPWTAQGGDPGVFTGSGSLHSLLSPVPDRFLVDLGFFFLPYSMCCAVCWDPHEERPAGISGCTQPWVCIYKRLLKPWGKKKISVQYSEKSYGSISSSFSKGPFRQE